MEDNPRTLSFPGPDPRAGGPADHRRFRNRIFVAQPLPHASHRGAEDRSVLRGRAWSTASIADHDPAIHPAGPELRLKVTAEGWRLSNSYAP